MADTISHVWQTVEQAAVTLNCSTRTIARRIAGGSMESRVDENGRRLVLVQTVSGSAAETPHDPTAPLADEDFSPATAIATPVQAASSDNTSLATEKASAVLAVLQSTIDAAREDAKVARTGARWAWAGIAALGLALAGTTVYLNQTATKAEVKATLLERQVTDTKAELGQTRNELLAAHAARAVAEQEKSVAIVREKDAESKLTQLETKVAAQPVETPAQPDKPAAAEVATVADRTEQPATQPTAAEPSPVELPLKSFVNSLLNDE